MKKLFIIASLFIIISAIFILPSPAQEQMTQAKFIANIVAYLHIQHKLPQDPKFTDYVKLLTEEGFKLPADMAPEKAISRGEKADLLSQLMNRDTVAADELAAKREKYRGRAIIQKMQGKVFVKVGGTKEWVPAEVNMSLSQTDAIKTGKNSSLHLKVGVGGNIIVKEETEVTLREITEGKLRKSEKILIYLAMGEITVDARFIEKDSTLETYTPTAVAAVRGTIYTVKVIPGSNKTEIREARLNYFPLTNSNCLINNNSFRFY